MPAKNEYIRKIDEIESNPEALKAIISAPDYFLDSYKKARLVGRVIKILVDEYGLVIDKKYNKFAEVYYNEIIKYRNALDRKSTRLNSSHRLESRMPSSA